MGFDPITMAATISKLTASGQIGSDGKTEKTYTFDGVVGDRPYANGFVFISSDTPDINSIKSVSAIFNGQLMTVGKDELTIQDKTTDMDGSFAAAYYGEYPAVYINFTEVGFPMGFYVLCGDENNFVSSVTFESGEVKTIDPKYLYPHFDLAAMGVPTIEMGKNYTALDIGAENIAAIADAVSRYGAVKCTFNMAYVTGEDAYNVAVTALFTGFSSEAAGITQGCCLMFADGTVLVFAFAANPVMGAFDFYTKVIA